MSSNQISLRLLAVLCVALGVPAVAHAQVEVRVVDSRRFFVDQPIHQEDPLPPLVEYLTRGTTLTGRAGTSRTQVVLFVVRTSKGSVVSSGKSAPFALDPKALSTSSGMALGSAVSSSQMSELPPIRPVADTPIRSAATAEQSINADKLVAEPTSAFSLAGFDPRVLSRANTLIVAVVPADPEARRRSTAAPMVVVF